MGTVALPQQILKRYLGTDVDVERRASGRTYRSGGVHSDHWQVKRSQWLKPKVPEYWRIEPALNFGLRNRPGSKQ